MDHTIFFTLLLTRINEPSVQKNRIILRLKGQVLKYYFVIMEMSKIETIRS